MRPSFARHVRTLRDQRGSASIELVILFPALLLLVTVLMQYALWFHARSLALAAAQEGVAAARVYGAVPADGATIALAFVAAHGADTLLGLSATASAPAVGQVEVVVTGRVLSVVPGVVGPAVTQSAAGPVERVTVAGGP